MRYFHRFRKLSPQAKKSIVVRYALMQVPEALVLYLVFSTLERWVCVPSWVVWGVAGIWLVKNTVLFFFVWSAFEAVSTDARQALVGAEGVAVEELDPSGYIRVHGVLWRAQVTEPGQVVHSGDNVVVHGVDGSLLTVRPAVRKGKGNDDG